ncbi:acyl-CoA desaturase [Jannaschia sp.]|nr:acyl-CoA desaturase [Jannaschia sp.]
MPDAPVHDRIDFGGPADPMQGRVVWSPVKSLWWTGMTVLWLTVGIAEISLSALAVFLVLTATTLCLGHSIGMHRLLIHRSFAAPRWLRRTLAYLGTLVGLGGPFTMMFTHDLRDWAQRSPACHPFLSHQNGIAKDFWWQLHCKLHLDREPAFRFPTDMTSDPVMRVLQSTSMLQQLPLALLLWAIGGWGWVAWGIGARVSVSILGHWLVGWFAHNGVRRDWHIEGASTQGYNVPHLGLVTFGECHHNNHHAFPGSARLGLEGQADPGWWVLCAANRLGLITNLQTPETLPPRPELARLSPKAPPEPRPDRPASPAARCHGRATASPRPSVS